MTLLLSLTVGIVFAASVWLLLSRELKSVAMGVFLLGHAANLAIIAVSRSPLNKVPPVLIDGVPLEDYADPLPQALILTAIVIAFATQAFLLTLLVITWRRAGSLRLARLELRPDGSECGPPLSDAGEDILQTEPSSRPRRPIGPLAATPPPAREVTP